jgi:CRISPR-associated protein Cas1
MGIEGEASRQYFGAMKEVLSPEVYKGQRTRQPPQDLFNALLGYGYGVLFTEIEKACILSGLNPYMGFLHADRPLSHIRISGIHFQVSYCSRQELLSDSSAGR